MLGFFLCDQARQQHEHDTRATRRPNRYRKIYVMIEPACHVRPLLRSAALVTRAVAMRPGRSAQCDAVYLAVIALAALLAVSACRDSAPTSPSGSAVVTFRVERETFRVRLTSDDQIARGRGRARRRPRARFQSGASAPAARSTPAGAGIWRTSVSPTRRSSSATACRRTSKPQASATRTGWYCPWGAE